PERVLLVDDNLDAATATAAILAQLGHEVCVAHSGAEALAVAARCAPSVAFLDIGLPDMDGYALAGALRRLGLAPRLVALTGYGQQDDIGRALDAGFDLHLTKPATLDELRRAVNGQAAPEPAASAG
ncbi:response regulator, partial [Massilia sp.]|uniref:response regulator n=1 Tax=Massilia sp. TaxID=1882437 RepID=UPI00289EEA6C